MDIRSALDRIIVIEKGLSITSPVRLSIKEAYKYTPSRQQALPTTPCWMNTWSMTREERLPGNRRQYYTVNAQLFVEDADLDRAADIASAFHVALVDELDADVDLNSTVSHHDFRGGEPTLVLLEWAGKSYIGLSLFLDLKMQEGKTFG